MKKLIPLFAFALILQLSASAAVPLKWTVETSRAVPAQFEAYQGETLALEAALQSYGKPLEAPSGYSIYWQTNGMGSTYWSAPCVATASSPSNVLFATWSPTNDVGARVYNCFIGKPGTIYHAAFQLRLRPSPGATPNELPLPQKVIDFAKVTVLNPPWSGGGVDTNAVLGLIAPATNRLYKTLTDAMPDGAARQLPRYLHALDFSDSYPDAAQEYYRSRGDGKVDGGCSSVRDGGFLARNFDFPFDSRSEFVVKMSAGAGRFASVGVAQVGTNLTEAIVTSGKPSLCYKWLPGATVDGINENGVVCEINVVDTEPPRRLGGDIHPLAAVRWALDNGTSAEMVATNLASRITWPSWWRQNFHWMIADATETWIVENGVASNVTGRAVITNFQIVDRVDGMGLERYNLLSGGANITNAWYTRAYRRETNPPWVSDLAEVIAYTNDIFAEWAAHDKEYFRGKTNSGIPWWQTVHTSIYDLANRTLRVAVQETDDWYTFAVPSAGGVKPEAVKEIVSPMISASTNGLRRVEDMAVYEVVQTENTDWTLVGNDGLTSHCTSVWSYSHFDFYLDGVYVASSDHTGGEADRSATSVIFVGGPEVGYTGYATRPRYTDESIATSTNTVLATIATNGSGAVATGDMVKLDANGRLVKATAGTDYLKEHQDISGKLDREVIDDAHEWGSYRLVYLGEHWCLQSRVMASEPWVDVFTFGAPGGSLGVRDSGSFTVGGETLYMILSAKQDALPYPTNAIPASVITGLEPPTSPTLRVYDDVRLCWWIGRMVNGVINWEVE